ncbi:gamma-glutamyltransferase [Bosea minatitlanensis]|uniref:Glutathione hydrolase proenzyme n=1 Tax=Bosea minatitlanensis TaxID=128782 RepID=A0ABW0FAL2_9HYPH|nr:gamma-glutamyltransferase [Bosea minatitlanensis]MCT4495837.1 gamma-glutamyltransferase [Bosea minatitlanensis]
MRFFPLALLPAALLAAQAALAQPLAPAPEAATGRIAKTEATAQRFMAATANPLAAAAGRAILRAGGSATDAAIAIQLVLNLVEPQSSGIGGGAFLVHWDETAGKVTTLDGRETAPAAARPDRFIRDGRPMPFHEAVIGGRSVGVPGTLKLLEEAHRRWGRLPWADLVAPALGLAEDGFAVSPRLNGLLAGDRDLPKNPRAAALFYEADGRAKAVGTLLKNPAFAGTLRAIAAQGADALYKGPIAEDIVATVAEHPGNPGDITLDDLAAYRVEERAPVCGGYRVWRLCGMGPPSSGAVAVQQMLGMLESVDLRRMGPGPEAAHWFSEAGRLAFADRNLYLADPAFIAVPVRGLLDRDYIRSRAALIDPGRSMGKAQAGDPPHRRAGLLAPSDSVEHGTSHISVVDAQGNAVAMTTTIEGGFGSHLMTKAGFLLNNELTDFDFAPEADGKPVANRVEPGKRPRSSMAPTLVFDAFGRLHAVVGSPGGSQIIEFVAKTLVALLDWRMDPQQAADFGNFGSRNGPTELEAGTEAEAWKPALEAKGHKVRLMEMTSGTQVIVKTPEGFLGGADGRREGVAIGD